MPSVGPPAGRGGTTASPLVTLSEKDCWSYLRSRHLGRLGVVAGGRATVFPVNYSVGDGAIVFRTAPGTKLTHGPGASTCFEVDAFDERSREGWSVMAFGTLEEITRATDARSRALRALPVTGAAPGDRWHWMALEVTELTGRWFAGGWIVPGGYLG